MKNIYYNSDLPSPLTGEIGQEQAEIILLEVLRKLGKREVEEHYIFLCVGKAYKLMDNQLASVCVNTSFESFFGANVLDRTQREVWQ